MANPILRLIWDSLHAADGGFTLRNFSSASGRSRNVQALINSLSLGAAVTAFALALAVSRTYLGEHWDYVVKPAQGGDELKVHAPPSSMLQIGHASMLSIDPSGVAVVR